MAKRKGKRKAAKKKGKKASSGSGYNKNSQFGL